MIEWLVQVQRAQKCLNWDSSPSLYLHVLSSPPISLFLPSQGLSGHMWCPRPCCPLAAQVWSQQPSSTCPPSFCTLPCMKSWWWVTYSLTKVLSVGCPQTHPHELNKRLPLGCDLRAIRKPLQANWTLVTKIILFYLSAKFFHQLKWKLPQQKSTLSWRQPITS